MPSGSGVEGFVVNTTGVGDLADLDLVFGPGAVNSGSISRLACRQGH